MWLFKEFLDLKSCNYFRWYRELWLFKEFLDLKVFSQLWQGYERPSRWVSMCLRMMNFLDFLLFVKGGPKKMMPMFEVNFLILQVDLGQNQGVFRIPHFLEIYLGVKSSQFHEDWPKLVAKNWWREEMKIYMKNGKIQNKIDQIFFSP